MRTLVRVRMDTERGNQVIQSGTVDKIMGTFIEQYNPEAAYFFADRGRRTASFVIDLKDSSQIPAIAEPFFQELNAEVQIVPVMNLDDLRKGLAVFGK